MMDLKQFAISINQIAEEKGISKEEIISTIEMALAAAYKRDYGEKGQNIQVKLDLETGTMKVNQIFLIVDDSMLASPEEIEERKFEEETDTDYNKIIFNPKRHIMLEDAIKENPDLKAGEELIMPLETKESFGRIAAQTAKQVIIQRLREAERNVIYDEFKKKENTVVSGLVQRIEKDIIYVDLGHIYAVMSPQDQVQTENYKLGNRIKVYINKVEKDNKGPVIFVSRSNPNLLKKIFEIEVPEIASNVVEIKGVAREAGSRSKVAVVSHDPNIDAVGACVGQRGARVNAVMSEIGNESIDIIEWSPDIEKYIANSLSPAKIIDINTNQEQNSAIVYVDSKQLSLAIGKNGQNVRLAAKLTGWKIDVKGAADEEQTTSETPEKQPAEEEIEKIEENKE